MFKLPFTLLSRVGIIALTVYIVSLGWENLGPRKPEIGTVRKELVDRIVPDIAEDIRTSRSEIYETALLHFANDPTDYFTKRLRSVVEQRGVLNLLDRTIVEKIRNVLRLRHPSYPLADLAVNRGRDLNARGVLFGAIGAFESYPGGARIDVEINLADVSTGQIVFSKRYNLETSPPGSVTATVEVAAQSFPWFKRFLYWVMIVLLLPVFTISFIRTTVKKESNKTNAFVLCIYTLIDSLLAWLLVGASLGSWWAVLFFLAAIAISLGYNIKVMSFAVRMEEA